MTVLSTRTWFLSLRHCNSGISFDFEYSLRMWYHGYQVGLYDSQFKDAKMPAGSKGKGGTMRSVNSFRRRLFQWRLNNLRLYYAYPGKAGVQVEHIRLTQC